MTSGLAGLRVFVAEDEFHVLQLIEDMLIELGCTVADSVSSVRAALEKAARIDAIWPRLEGEGVDVEAVRKRG